MLKYHTSLSNFAFNIDLRRYTAAGQVGPASFGAGPPGLVALAAAARSVIVSLCSLSGRG
jgi:hypothetical protein